MPISILLRATHSILQVLGKPHRRRIMEHKMAIRTRKPRTASLRFQTFLDTRDLTTNRPHKSLVVGLKKRGGRNTYGRITCRHVGGGAARKYRIIDFGRTER